MKAEGEVKIIIFNFIQEWTNKNGKIEFYPPEYVSTHQHNFMNDLAKEIVDKFNRDIEKLRSEYGIARARATIVNLPNKTGKTKR